MADLRRPYRVGTQRSPQRYIPPDEIYEDLQRGPPLEMPRQFPYSWNPVNGLSGVPTGVGAIGDEFLNLVKDVTTGVAKDTQQSVENRASSGIDDFLRSTPGKQLLTAVEGKAAEGVTKVVKKQAPNLMLLAVAGGAVGGAVSAKLGKAGTIAALGVALWAGFQVMNATTTTK